MRALAVWPLRRHTHTRERSVDSATAMLHQSRTHLMPHSEYHVTYLAARTLPRMCAALCKCAHLIIASPDKHCDPNFPASAFLSSVAVM